MSETEILHVKNVSKYFGGLAAVNNCSLRIKKGSITGIIGPNGSGKTSLLKILFGLNGFTKGSIQRFYSVHDSSFIFQQHTFLNMTVSEIFNHVLFCKNIKKSERLEIIEECLEKYNIQSFKNKNVRVLSGGEKQIIALIRSIILKPKVIFYDEPLNNLDSDSVNFIIKILKQLYDNEVKLIIVTHDNNLLKNLDCEIIRIFNGEVLDD